VSVTVEAKAGEEFDKPIEQWIKQESNGKERRLTFLTKELGLLEPPPGFIRYQLVHRTVASVLEARRCHFKLALMLVQSFEESPSSWLDYEKFANLLGIPLFEAKSWDREKLTILVCTSDGLTPQKLLTLRQLPRSNKSLDL